MDKAEQRDSVRAAIGAYTGNEGGILEETITDLMADLLLYAHDEGLDAEKIEGSAWLHYTTETA